MVLGALDKIFGNKYKLGEKFDEGFMAMGPLSIAMLGVVSIAPVLADVFGKFVVPVYVFLGADPAFIRKNMETLFLNARKALYSGIEPSVIKGSCIKPVSVSTNSSDRDDYLAHPTTGETISGECIGEIINLNSKYNSKPNIQFVISDGLNADAVSEHLKHILPPIRKHLMRNGKKVSPFEIVLKNGRVRAGYHIGRLLRPEMTVHFIGERREQV